MNRWTLTNALALLVLGVLMSMSVPARAMDCAAELERQVINEDILVNGDCVMRGVTVKGTVRIEGGTLEARRGTLIIGDLEAFQAGDITLTDTGVIGSISLSHSSTLKMTGSNAQSVSLDRSGDLLVRGGYLGDVRLHNSGDLKISGDAQVPVDLTGLSTLSSGSIRLTSVRVFPGGVNSVRASGDLRICASEIGAGQVPAAPSAISVRLMESRGDLVADGSACGPSRILGDISVGRGVGSVRLTGATLAGGDLVVVEQAGDVAVEDSALDGMRLERNTGATSLQRIALANETTITENDGDVRITGSELGDDVLIRSNRAVTVTGNNMVPDEVRILNNAGPIVVEDNVDLSLSAIEPARGTAAKQI